MRKRVLIMGGGFAGIAAAREFSRQGNSSVSVTLIDRHRWNVFWPLLPDVISARVSPSHISYHLEPFCRRHGIHFIHTEVEEILPYENKVQTRNGSLRADYFIICLGCETDYRGNKKIRKHAPGLKSLNEAVRIHEMVKQLVEGRRSSGGDSRRIIVVGGGYTGFETASHIVHLLHAATGQSFYELRKIAKIEIVERAPKVLGNTSPGIQRWAERLVQKYGVEVKKGTTIKRFENEHTVRMSDGARYKNAMVVWNAGLAPGPSLDSLDVPTVQGGRLMVDSFLRVNHFPHVFAAGDVAGPFAPGCHEPLRMSVQFSEAGGKLAAANVLRDIKSKPLRPFVPSDLGYVIPLAPGEAVGLVLGREIHGRIPFYLHYMMSVIHSYGWKNKISVARDLWVDLSPGRLRRKKRLEQKVERFEA